MPSNLSGQNEQPREARGGYQRDAQQAHPVTGEQHEDGMFRRIVRGLQNPPFRIQVRIVHANFNSSRLLAQGGFSALIKSGGLFQSSRVLYDRVDLVVG